MILRSSIGSKIISSIAATTLALSMTVAVPGGAAFADSLSTDGYVTIASGCGPNTATAEILGLSNYEENFTFFTDKENLPDSLFTFSTPRYMMWGTTEYNENPNPFYYNTLYDYNGSSLKMIYNSDGRTGVDGFRGGPDTSLGKYGTGTVTDQIWDRLPDMVSGSSAGASTTRATASHRMSPATARSR